MLDYIFLVAGLSLLVLGGDILVRGSVAIAERLNISPLIIGLTIVSLGTSAPELFISLQAAFSGSGELAIGNVVGSNIANILLVLGLPAIIMTNPCDDKHIGRSILVMIGVTAVFMGMLSKGEMGSLDGLILLTLLGLFLWDQYRTAIEGKNGGVTDYQEDVPEVPANLVTSLGLLLGGLLILPLAAWLTVDAAQNIARTWGVSDEVIGLTVVAIGTSLPELAASLMAVIRGNTNVAIGNVVGSNVFNIVTIMGITTLVTPITVGYHVISVDMWIMFAVALYLAWLAFYRHQVSRRSGIIMTTTYVAYLAVAFLK